MPLFPDFVGAPPGPPWKRTGPVLGFFIDRPIFSGVIAIVILLVGGVAAFLLPIARFPDIAPPTIRVSATFTGGSAQDVADAVTTPLEEAINGVDGLIYLSSTSGNDGTSTIQATFEVGYDVDIAAVDVLTRVNQARSRLPAEVQALGVTVEKSSPQITGVVSLYSPDGTYDGLFLSNYAQINVIAPLNRVPGVGRVQNFSELTYAIRVWLDPERMEYLRVSPQEVRAAIEAQNTALAAGTIGQPPVPDGAAFQLQVTTTGRLATEEEFADIIVRARPDGSVVRVRDIGRVELGAENYGSWGQFSGKTSAQIGIFQSPEANALEVVGSVRAELERLSQRFPEGLEYSFAFDTTRFVQTSIREVVITLGIAIALVVATVFLFLQDWRATLIPCLAIPVSLVGSLAVFLALGFSINTLSLLGLVLAVGVVVDDAIVVVENIERNIQEGRAPRDAAKQAMAEVVGPVIATTLVLLALFVPVAFIPGITGQLYNQFALTVAIAVGLSTLVSLTLTPALSAVLLKPGRKERKGRFFTAFNRGFDKASTRYRSGVARALRAWPLVLGGFLAMGVATAWLFVQRPTDFVPDEDQGYFIVDVQLPEGAALERTQAVVAGLERKLLDRPEVAETVAVAGSSLIGDGNASYFGFLIAVLKDWGDRETGADALIQQLQAELGASPDARVRVINPPSLPGIGSGGGLQLELQDYRGEGVRGLAGISERFLGEANGLPEIARAFTAFSADVPQLRLDIDRAKVEQLGVGMDALNQTVSAYLGSVFVNDFNRFGQPYRVYIQAEGKARAAPEDIGRLAVLNSQGQPVPLSTLATVSTVTGPATVRHYNLYPAVSINAQPAPGASSGEAIAALEGLAARALPGDFGYEWTGAVYQQVESGNYAPVVFALAVLFVFLVLAAQYESWVLPAVIVLAVPLAIFGAMVALLVTNTDLNVFVQIGLLLLVGLAAKNSILLVSFAADQRAEGKDMAEAALEAARLRLRPILMTAVSFILGCVPLVVASGAGANARQALGTTVIGGMLVATILTLFVTPVFYVLAERLRGRRERHRGGSALPAA